MATKKKITRIDEVLPNRNLEVKIIGLAISYFDVNTNQWKACFPKASRHRFQVEIRELDTSTANPTLVAKNQFPLSMGSRIEVKNNNVIGGCNDMRPYYENFMLDITRLHGQIHLLNEPDKYAGFLTVNETTLFADETKKPNYDFWKVVPYIPANPAPRTKTWIENKTIVKSGIFAGNFADRSTTEILIVNSGLKIVLTHSPNRLYQIDFQNFCVDLNDKECEESDFKHYYDIIDESKFGEKSRFELIPKPTPKGARGKTGSCDEIVASNLVIPQGLI